MANKGRNNTIVQNRKARHEYHFDEVFEAGIVLTGSEVKALRDGKASLQEAYCYVNDQDELMITGMNIAIYDQASIFNHEPTRERKLLMKKKQIRRLRRQLDEKGMTLVPIRLYFNDRNFVKLELALAKGKKLFDKRHDIKSRDTQRELDRAMNDY